MEKTMGIQDEVMKYVEVLGKNKKQCKCTKNSYSYGLIHYTNYYVIYKAKDKRYGDVYLPIAYENLKLLSDGSIVAEEYPYVKTEFLKELFGNIDDMCDSITNGSSVVSGELSNYFK